jgi:hypothetical protein
MLSIHASSIPMHFPSCARHLLEMSFSITVFFFLFSFVILGTCVCVSFLFGLFALSSGFFLILWFGFSFVWLLSPRPNRKNGKQKDFKSKEKMEKQTRACCLISFEWHKLKEEYWKSISGMQGSGIESIFCPKQCTGLKWMCVDR